MSSMQHPINPTQQVISNQWQPGVASANDSANAGTAVSARQKQELHPLRRQVDLTDPGVPTGFAALDQALPWQGLPTRGLIEIICSQKNLAELQLLLPVLQQRSQGKQSLLWMTPPYALHGEALRGSGINLKNSFVIPAQAQCNQALWSLEKALQSKECSTVLAWQNWLSGRVLRRLELAAQQGNTLGVVFHKRPQPRSPSTLQMQIEVATDRLSGKRVLDVTVLQVCGQEQTTHHRLVLS